MSMQLDYFYGGEADQFSFYRIPKVLFSGASYKSIGRPHEPVPAQWLAG